jgi:hypothetical protein
MVPLIYNQEVPVLAHNCIRGTGMVTQQRSGDDKTIIVKQCRHRLTGTGARLISDGVHMWEYPSTKTKIQLGEPLSACSARGNYQHPEVGFQRQEGLDHQAGLDGLPKADLIGEQESRFTVQKAPSGSIELVEERVDSSAKESRNPFGI